MKVFFQIKFSITAKEETQIEEELSNYVLTWLESKYGVAAKRAISACKSLLSDSEFGDPNGLFVETVHYEDVKYAQHNLWACKVMEPPKRWGKFAPRRCSYADEGATLALLLWWIQYIDRFCYKLDRAYG